MRSFALLALLALAGCDSGQRCPTGTYWRAGSCVPLPVDSGPPTDGGPRVDAGLDARAAELDAASDGATDGGAIDDGAIDGASCGCPPERPLCTDGGCAGCLSDGDCAGTICIDEECSSAIPGDAGLCEACVADRHCPSGMACVDVDGDGPRCVRREDGIGGSCVANGRPFTRRLVEIVDGASLAVCVLRASTCAAWLDFDTACASAADCGSGSGDLCQDADPGPSTVPHCTLPCATDNDCPATVACDRRLGFCLTQ